MRLPKFSILYILAHEVWGRRTLKREPEPALIMDDPEEVAAYNKAGETKGSLQATYIFNLAYASEAISGAKSVIDLGCGPANFLLMLAELHPEIEFVGVDLSETMLDIARQKALGKNLKNVKFQCMDISTLNTISDQTFDAAISTFALHHLPKRSSLENTFYNIRRILKPNGKIYIFDFGRLKSLKSVFYFAYRDRDSLPYLFTLDYERSLRAAFRIEDFQELKTRYFGDEVKVIGTFKAALMIMMRSTPRPISKFVSEGLQRMYKEMAPQFRDDIDDLRLFFKMSGIDSDPFGKFQPSYHIKSRLRMLKMSTLGVQVRIAVNRFARLAIVAVLVLRTITKLALLNIQTVFLSRQRALSKRSDAFETIGGQVYTTLSHLKGAAAKIGQTFSYLPVGLPMTLTTKLEDLQSHLIPLDGRVIRNYVERELGQPIEKLFSEWKDTPLAAASVSQVHYARLLDGQPVVVKVKYPQIDQIVACDIKNFRLLKSFFSHLTGISNVDELIDELHNLMIEECNFEKAGQYQEEFRKFFKDDLDIVIPHVYSHYSTNNVLTMDYFEGLNYEEFKNTSSQEEKNRAGEIIWKFTAVSVNNHGLYNADPHPGNYLFADNKVCFLDFGFTKRYDSEFIKNWKTQTLSACRGDLETFTVITEKLGFVNNSRTFQPQLLMESMLSTFYASYIHDKIFTFDKGYVEKELQAIAHLYKAQEGNRLPVEFLSITRLVTGLHAILADLNASANWHRGVFHLLEKHN